MLMLRIYTNVKPAALNDPDDITKRIYDYIGPAIVDRSGWGLLRPGILTGRLVNDVCNAWGAKGVTEILTQLPISDSQGSVDKKNWIFFDYLFTKPISANPIIRCLTNLGLAEYGEIKVGDTYNVLIGFNYKTGILIMLYNRRNIEKELDEIAYVVSHTLNASNPYLVEVTKKLLINMAIYMQDSSRWELKGWESKDGRNIELDLVEKNKNEYLVRIRNGEWRSLIYQDKYSNVKLKLTIRAKRNQGKISINKALYKLEQRGDLAYIFDELFKRLKLDRFNKVSPNGADEAGILRAYTERRGIMATIMLEKNKGKDPSDLSYESLGYDVRSDSYLIEVKAFKDSLYKVIRLTENEYKIMSKEENYCIYVVENAWSSTPRINIIYEPTRLLFVNQHRPIHELKLRTSSEEYYECEEDKWRGNVATTEEVRI